MCTLLSRSSFPTDVFAHDEIPGGNRSQDCLAQHDSSSYSRTCAMSGMKPRTAAIFVVMAHAPHGHEVTRMIPLRKANQSEQKISQKRRGET